MTLRAQVVMALKSPSCTSCNIRFENMERLNVHMRVKHQETDDLRIVRLTQFMQKAITRDSSIVIWTKSLDRTECGEVFVNENYVKIHIDKHYNSVSNVLKGIKKRKG